MKYRSHEKLGISFAEYGALLGTRAMLAAKVIEHGTQLQPNKHLFDMGTACTMERCGSVTCIGGTMGLIMFDSPTKAQEFVDAAFCDVHAVRAAPPSIWSELFFPGIVSLGQKGKWKGRYTLNYERITPKQAILAIDNFLSGKTKRPWPKAVLKKVTVEKE